jgi:arylsulfatase A-like enzyme
VTCHAGWEPELAQRLLTVAGDRAGWKYRALEAAPTAMNRTVMLRTRSHKYVVRAGGADELYDLVADPTECHDIAGDPSSGPLLAGLRRDLLDALLLGADRRPVPELEELLL